MSDAASIASLPASDAAAITPEIASALVDVGYCLAPDWDAVFEGENHDWCAEASRAGVGLLHEHGVSARLDPPHGYGGLRGNGHRWIRLDDGTVVDITVGQYIDEGLERWIDATEVPWTLGVDDEPLAVIPPDHPFAAEYVIDVVEQGMG